MLVVQLFSLGQVQLGLAPRVRRLKPEAVPTVFKHSEAQAPKRCLHTEERLKKKHRSSAVHVCILTVAITYKLLLLI